MQKNDDPRNMFCNQRRQFQKDTTEQTENSNQTSNPSDYERRLKEMKELAAKYQREGEGQLVKDILESVLEQKASGNLTNEQLLAFAKRISPLLNADQRTRLNELVEQLVKL